MTRTRRRVRHLLCNTGIAIASLFAIPSVGSAQTTSAFTACTPGALGDCARIQLSALYGGGVGGSTLFTIAVQNLGSQTSPGIPTSIYNLIFGTGQAPDTPGSELDTPVTPATGGAATLTDPSAWDVYDSGDAVFLSAFGGNGVGGCVAGPSVGGFDQAGQTCGPSDYLIFSFSTPNLYDPTDFALLDYEVVGLNDDLPGDSCGGAVACSAPITSATPEPNSIMLAATGLVGIVAIRRHRRRGTERVTAD